MFPTPKHALFMCFAILSAFLCMAVHPSGAVAQGVLAYSEVVEAPASLTQGKRAFSELSAESYDALADMIYDSIYAWEEGVSLKISFEFDEATLEAGIRSAAARAIERNDYISFAMQSYGFRIYRISDYKGNLITNLARIEFSFSYRTTSAEEDAVTQRVEEILDHCRCGTLRIGTRYEPCTIG
jgi:hypothetical protein